jgi:hypothetical protein
MRGFVQQDLLYMSHPGFQCGSAAAHLKIHTVNTTWIDAYFSL